MLISRDTKRTLESLTASLAQNYTQLIIYDRTRLAAQTYDMYQPFNQIPIVPVLRILSGEQNLV
jgi:hypothetical protein